MKNKQKDFEGTIPTYGYSPQKVTFDNKNILFVDLGGGERIRGIWDNYYADSYGCVYVIDGTDEERLEKSLETLNSCMNNEFMKGKPFLVFVVVFF